MISGNFLKNFMNFECIINESIGLSCVKRTILNVDLISMTYLLGEKL